METGRQGIAGNGDASHVWKGGEYGFYVEIKGETPSLVYRKEDEIYEFEGYDVNSLSHLIYFYS